MEDVDTYLRLCIKQYAAQQDLDEYVRERLLKDANRKPRDLSARENVAERFSSILTRLERWVAWPASH